MTQERRRLDAEWLREAPLRDILTALERDGEQARVVGGAVRNALLGEPHGDIDIATTVLPSEVIRRVEAAGFKAVPTGIEHGTVTVVAAGRPFEVTTLREDVETFGRHATVAFGRDWKRDAERRDFTMNALSLSRDGTIYDYVGGLADIEARRVRFIGEAATRIAEDYLRILRFFRFHAAYGEGAPDPQGLAACIDARAGLEQLSRERVRMEVFKLLVAKHAVPTLALMTEIGLLEQVLGGVPLLASYANMIKLEAALAFACEAVRRLAALSVSLGEDAERLRERLRLAKAEYERLAHVVTLKKEEERGSPPDFPKIPRQWPRSRMRRRLQRGDATSLRSSPRGALTWIPGIALNDAPCAGMRGGRNSRRDGAPARLAPCPVPHYIAAEAYHEHQPSSRRHRSPLGESAARAAARRIPARDLRAPARAGAGKGA